VGGTFPRIISKCKKTTGKKLNIYSPGIGTQGGKAKEAISSGSDFLIIGRTILNSKDPVYTAKQLQLSCI
jgi:orotidine-5'-phosphate decarboxylase